MLGAQAKFLTVGLEDTSKKGMDLDSVGIGLKSYWKFSGYAVDKVPIYIEVALAENERCTLALAGIKEPESSRIISLIDRALERLSPSV